MRTALLGLAVVTLGLGFAGGCTQPKGEPLTLDTIEPELLARPLYTFNEAEADLYIRALHASEPDLIRRVMHIGRKNIGQPYDIYLLGEFPFEYYDPEPIYCLSRSDCLTFCEHTYAMALASDWWEFMRVLQRIRYCDGVIGMLTRNHYGIADWNRNNDFLLEDLTTKLGDGQAGVPLTQVCRRARFFSKFGIGQDIPDEPISDMYIPKANIPSILNELRDGDLVNIIRGNASSQWSGHATMVAIGADGTVNLLHSARPAVREQPLLGYVNGNKGCVGIKVLRLRPNAQEIIREELACETATTRPTEVSEASMNAALARRRAELPATAQPPMLDWRGASNLQAYRLGYETPVDAGLQEFVEELDRELGTRFDIPPDERALGVLDLTDLRLALVRPDEMFYGASVPKVCILLAYFETHPEAVTELPDDVRKELGRMIKVSDNSLAAKYGRLVGIEKVQEVLQSKPYRFYDQEHGGGFWYGKHYSKGNPRFGDPVHDYSHGATVRQCLRYYLMLEQGRLVSPAACARMREIFAAPELELGQSKFVAGLQGRDLSLIRKSGTWQDWHLDTARVEHGGRVFLLAGMAHHPQGGEYLDAAAAAVDEHLCGAARENPYVHQLVMNESAADFEGGTVSGGLITADPPGVLLRCTETEGAEYVSPVIRTDTLFNEVVPSWNAAPSPHLGFGVEVRVGLTRDDTWSPWLYVSDWGGYEPPSDRVIECEDGWIEVDFFKSERRFDRVQYRLRAACVRKMPAGSGGVAYVRLARMAVCLSDTTGWLTSVPRPDVPPQANDTQWQRRLPVPYRSQTVERKEVAGLICSPTSVSMVLEYRGVDRPTEEVAERVYDATYEIYGNWPRAVQTAYSYGVPGYLRRFSDWAAVEHMIAAGQPLIISIQAADGELAGAPYESTEGHLLVLTGFDADGNVTVNDPAARTPETGRLVYTRDDLETVWMMPKGGTAYVLLPLPRPATVKAVGAEEPMVELSAIDPRIVVDLRYATADNFTGRQLYPTARCLLRESVARRLSRVRDRLAAQGLGLKVYDAYRPLSVQRRMWEVMPNPTFVADPEKGSRHNRGAAVDVTLVDARGRELEMPTAFDDFGPAAHRDYTGGTLLSRRNRDLLTDAMEAEGFHGLAAEWWHFDAVGWESYPIADVPLDAK